MVPCRFSFVSLFRLRSLSFSCFRLSWLLLISSPLLFLYGVLGLLVPEFNGFMLFALSSSLCLSFIFACAFVGLYVTFGARALVVLPHFQFVFALVVIGSCFYLLCLFACIAEFGSPLHVPYSFSLVRCENPLLFLRQRSSPPLSRRGYFLFIS